MTAPLEYAPVVLLDCGSGFLRAGYGNEDGPRLSYPPIVGYPRNRGVVMAAGMHEYEIGEEAVAKRGMLNCRRPIHNGRVQSWDDMERLWSHVMFNQLRVIPENHSFIVTQAVNVDAKQKEKTLELMMETFNVHSLFLGVSPVLSLYSYGKTTGLVVDGGRDSTTAVPVFEGYALGRHVTESLVGGEVLTQYLAHMLRKEGYTFSTAAEMDALNAAKEAHCYVSPSRFPLDARPESSILRNVVRAVESRPVATASPDTSSTLNKSGDTKQHGWAEGFEAASSTTAADGSNVARGSVGAIRTFQLPDGQEVPLGEQRHDCPEALFDFSIAVNALQNPSLATKLKALDDMGEEFEPSFAKGLSWLPFAAIGRCSPSLRAVLYRNIVMVGGGMSLPGTRRRLVEELTQLYRETHHNEAVTPISVDDVGSRRKYTAWLGGAMLSRMSMFPHLTVSKREYEEQGHRVVHCKCL